MTSPVPLTRERREKKEKAEKGREALDRREPQPGQGAGNDRGGRGRDMYAHNSGNEVLGVEVWGMESHLRVVQLVLPHDLDGALAARLTLDGLVDIGEGTVAHLFDKAETFETLYIACQWTQPIRSQEKTGGLTS